MTKKAIMMAAMSTLPKNKMLQNIPTFWVDTEHKMEAGGKHIEKKIYSKNVGPIASCTLNFFGWEQEKKDAQLS